MDMPSTTVETDSRPGRTRAPLAAVTVGDPAAFEQLMREHNQRLFRLAFGLVGDAGEAEDVLQDSYVQAFLNLASFAGRSSPGAWLASIVRNEAIDHIRARRARKAIVTLEADLPGLRDQRSTLIERAPSDPAFSEPELSLDSDEARTLLETAIAELPLPFRAVFMLREVEGLSVLETSEYLGVPTATVKTRGHRARRMLRSILGTAFDGDARHAFPFLRDRCDRLVARVRAQLTST
jgi:RNA polymerase sigma-70 factor (ECF subfamily)